MRILKLGEVNLPAFSENKSKGFISWGKDNNYPNYIINLKRTSPKHAAILKRKADMTASKGFIETTLNKEFIKNSFSKDSLDTVAFKAAFDLCLHNAFAIQVTWSIDKTSISKIEYIDISKIRVTTESLPQEKNSDFFKACDLEYFWYSDNWKDSKCIPQLVQEFSTKYRGQIVNESIQGSSTQIFCYFGYEPGCDFYTLPEYIAGESYIALDAEIGQFHLQNVKNGFAPSYMINFNTIPTDEEMDAIYKDLEKQYAGSKNAGKVILTFSDGKERAPEINKIDLNASDERFRDLSDQIKENIFLIHSCSETILGGSTEGKLGGTQELINSYTIFIDEVIAPKQKVIEDFFNKCADINGAGEMKLEDYNPFKNVIDSVNPNNKNPNLPANG